MKKIIIPIFIVIIALLLVSCEDKDEVADKIVEYYNEEWVPINDMKEKRMRDPLSEQARLESENKEEEAASLVKEEMVPIADKVLERLKAVDAGNKYINKMNDMQIEAEEIARDMFTSIITYYEGGDVTEKDINEYREDMKDKYQEVLDYRDELMEEYNLEQAENENENSGFYKLERAED